MKNNMGYAIFACKNKSIAILVSNNLLERLLFAFWWIFPRTCYKVLKTENLQKRSQEVKWVLHVIVFVISHLLVRIVRTVELPAIYGVSSTLALMMALMCYVVGSVILNFLFFNIQKRNVILDLDFESKSTVKIQMKLSLKNISVLIIILFLQYKILTLMISILESPSNIDLISTILFGMIIQLLNMCVLSITYVSLDNLLYYPKQ